MVLDSQVELIFNKVRPQIVGDGVSSCLELLRPELNKILEQENFAQLLAKYLDPENFDINLDNIPKKGEIVPITFKCNLGQGATPEFKNLSLNFEFEEEIKNLAIKAAAALGVRFSCVDIVKLDPDDHGGVRFKVIEVNSSVMVSEYVRHLGEQALNEARTFYRKALVASFKSSADDNPDGTIKKLTVL